MPTPISTPSTNPPLSLKSAWQVSIDIFTKHFGKLTAMALVPNVIIYLLVVVLQVVAVLGVREAGSLSAFISWTNPYAWLAALLILTLSAVSILGVVALLYTVVRHEHVKFIEAFEHALDYIVRYILQFLLATLVGLVGVAIGIFILFIFGLILGRFSLDIFNSLYTWISVIPFITGTAASLMVVFAQFSIIEKNHSAWEAIRYSVTLTRAHFWRILGNVLVLMLAVFVIGFALTSIPVLGSIISLLTLAPFTIVYLYVLYALSANVPVLDAQPATVTQNGISGTTTLDTRMESSPLQESTSDADTSENHPSA